jgi:hypothetical protein
VNCHDDLQWIVQCFKGGQWRNKSFHRSRQSLIRRYGPLEIILALPDHHDGLEDERRCRMCGRVRGKPRGGLARYLFCLGREPISALDEGPGSRKRPTTSVRALRSWLKVSGAPLLCDYFGTPTNRAPVTLPSAPISGA